MINHKEEVLKVYPDAVCNPMYNGDYISEYVVWDKGNIKGYGGNIKSAWQNAYNNIKNQNK